MKKNFISIILIIIGLALIVTSLGLKIYSKNKEKQLLNKFNNEIKEEKNKQNSTNKVKDNQKEKKIEQGKEIATIEIPSIDLKSIIVEGIEKEYLRYYLGHFHDSVMPGKEGNFCIAGHSSFIYNEILNDLYKVNINDKIKINTIDGEFNYVITEKFIVAPTAVSVLEKDKGKKNITIVTCTNGGKKRLIVKGEIKNHK